MIIKALRYLETMMLAKANVKVSSYVYDYEFIPNTDKNTHIQHTQMTCTLHFHKIESMHSELKEIHK